MFIDYFIRKNRAKIMDKKFVACGGYYYPAT
jgi:hypothetical protein